MMMMKEGANSREKNNEVKLNTFLITKPWSFKYYYICSLCLPKNIFEYITTFWMRKHLVMRLFSVMTVLLQFSIFVLKAIFFTFDYFMYLIFKTIKFLDELIIIQTHYWVIKYSIFISKKNMITIIITQYCSAKNWFC